MKNNQKLMYALIVLLAAGAIALIVSIFLNIKQPDSGGKTLEKAELVTMSDELVDGMKASGGVSESFFSTKLDKSAVNQPILFKDYMEFRKYLDKYWDIHVTYPEGVDNTIAQYKFSDGYVAVVIAADKLQSVDREVRVNAVYRNETNVVYELCQYSVNPTYGYSVDMNKDCKAVYTIIYISPEDAANIDNITFAINDKYCVNGGKEC